MICFSTIMRNGFLTAFGVSLGALSLVALVLLPTVTAIFAALILWAQLLLMWVCNAHALRGFKSPKTSPRVGIYSDEPPFLSVHLPAHNEPPSVFIATLESLKHQQNAPPHEIVVMVNNTADPALWYPVAAWCAAAGQPFRFLRQDGVTGAKAGALNIALRACNPAATHVVVIDADYCVVPDFLRIIADQITRTRADFIQFPQAYRHLTAATEGLSVELADYFNRHARAANMAQAMLLTGTLSVISRKSLVAVGGWPVQSGTEDAALGSNLIAKGYRGVFIDRIVGRGLMPLDLAGLHQQRHRWAAGNAQVLLHTLRRWMQPDAPASAGLQKMLVTAQLAAWLNLGVLAGVILGLAMVQLALGLAVQGAAASIATIGFSVLTFIVIICSAIYPLLWSGSPVAHRRQALVSRLAMLPISGYATLTGVLTRHQGFRVTPKRITAAISRTFPAALTVTAAAAVGVVGAGFALHNTLAIIAGLLLVIPPACSIAAARALASYSAAVTLEER